ncbi:MAG TPA: PilN domain-containing protein, partial [Syntrophobacteraceae bacterium]|nr:PilN domain-containing protein [Syntrophobacteraceae bacterium]
MIQINLLPVRTRKKRETGKQFIVLYLLCVLLAGGVIGYLWISKESEIAALNKRLAQVQAEVKKYAQYEVMLQELKSKKEVVDRKRGVVEDLQRDRDSIARLLAVLSIQVPSEKMWFERLAQTANNVTVDGVALSNEAIVEFMRNLESS